MDNVDYRIVKILEQNGRISHEEIAKQLHMSRQSIRGSIIWKKRELLPGIGR